MPYTIQKNTLNLLSISPKCGAKFSPNLYKWLSHKSSPHRAWTSRIYKASNGTLWIGRLDNRELIGSRLISVLCNGAKESTAAWQNIDAVEIENFWQDYESIGRCAIDKDHSMYFIGDDTRWSVSNNKRSCLWCGNANQTLKRWTEQIEKSEWVNQ
jgi:hypothetical protein